MLINSFNATNIIQKLNFDTRNSKLLLKNCTRITEWLHYRVTTARARERELQELQSYSCYRVTRGVTGVTGVTVTSIFSLNPLFVEKVEQNHRNRRCGARAEGACTLCRAARRKTKVKAKFVGSPLVVGKMIATHFWKPSKGHHFLTLRLRVALDPQTFAVRDRLTHASVFFITSKMWIKRGRQLFGKRAGEKICVKTETFSRSKSATASVLVNFLGWPRKLSPRGFCATFLAAKSGNTLKKLF